MTARTPGRGGARASDVAATVSAVDTLGDVATVQYVVTIQQATASANGTVDNATIEVDLIG